MTSSESLRASIDVGLATEQGDIDIADDLLKSSAFMVALASAAVYFALAELKSGAAVRCMPNWQTILYLLCLAFLAGSLLSATRVHASHTRFRALCRNMIVARKLLLAELIEKAADLEAVTKESPVPLWALVTSGQITELIASPAAVTFPQTQERQAHARSKLGSVHKLQRSLVSIGLVLLLASAATPHLLRVAA
jgi:hypothetical protein